METFYQLVNFIYLNVTNFINTIAVFMTRDIGTSISSIITQNDIWQPILEKILDVSDILGIYNYSPLEIMVGVGLPAILIWTLIKWLLPTS